MGTGSRKSSHHQRSGSNPINPSSSNSIPSHASAVSATSEDYVDMSPAGSGSGSRPGAVPIPNRNMSSTSLTFGTSPSAGKVEKILKSSLDSIPSPSPSVKIQIMGGKVYLRCKGKTLLGIVNKLLKTKSLLTSPNNVLPLHLK